MALVARSLAVTADVDALVARSGGLKLMGFSAREVAAVAVAATFRIINGTTGATTAPVVFVEINADESTRDWYGPDGIDCPDGISIDWIAGTFDVVVYYR